MIMIAKFIVALTSAYLMTGLLVGLAFLFRQVEKQDPAARGVYAFRPLVLPGLALLWPLVLVRWISHESAAPAPVTVARHKQAHRIIWAALALFILLTLWLATSIRLTTLPEQPSLRLSLAESALT
jgi:hypothetical protein